MGHCLTKFDSKSFSGSEETIQTHRNTDIGGQANSSIPPLPPPPLHYGGGMNTPLACMLHTPLPPKKHKHQTPYPFPLHYKLKPNIIHIDQTLSNKSIKIKSRLVAAHLTLSWQRLIISGVKWGSCLRKESLFHSACVVIWASSMAARAGLSQPLELSTSTHAWISRIACSDNNHVNVLDSVCCWNSACPHTPGSVRLPVQTTIMSMY